MATITMPIVLDTEAPAQRITATLDGTEYLLTIAYNLRDEAFYVSLSQSDGTLLVGSQPLIADWPLFSPYKRTDDAMPQGDLFLVGQALVYHEAA